MKIKNKSARLIDFSWNKEKFRLMPAGDAVEVPKEAMKSAFLKSLIDSGDVAISSKEDKSEDKAEDKSEDNVETKADELEALRTKAKGLGIKFKPKWGVKKLTAEIKKKKEGS